MSYPAAVSESAFELSLCVLHELKSPFLCVYVVDCKKE
jgi:hypothetical protein